MPISPKPRCLLISDYSPMCSVYDMARDIRSAMVQAGVSVADFLRADPNPSALHQTMLKALLRFDGPRFLFDMNASENYEVGGKSLYDAFNLPRFSFITDSPTRLINKIAEMPKLSVLGVVDGDHAQVLADFDIPCRAVVNFPHAGPPPEPDPAPVAERDIDILFAGYIAAMPETSVFLDGLSGGDSGRRSLLAQVLDRIRAEPVTIYLALREALPDLSAARRADLANAIEDFLIATRRMEILQSLEGRRVRIHGEIDAAMRRSLPDTFDYADPVMFETVADLMGRSRCVINSSPSFRNGAHERVFYALSRGAAVATEPTRFFNAADSSALALSSLPFGVEGIAEAVDAAIETSDEARQKAMAAYGKTHTWQHRIEAVLPTILALS